MNQNKRAKSFLILLSAVAFFQLHCGSAKSVTKTPAGETLVFFDDFSSDSLDRSKWNVIVTGFTVNNEQQAYVDSSATISMVRGAEAEGASNGALQLRPIYSPGFKTKEGRTFDFISGRIDSRDKVDFLYGTASARIKLTDGPGLWPAWWLLGNGSWPGTGEIDIMEYIGEKDWAGPAVHGPGYSGETPFVDKYYFPGNKDVTDWHIYAVEWTPDSLLFKYDGQLVLRVTRPMVEHYGKWVFDTKKFMILNFALGGAFPVKMNGVKTPYNGLPGSTVELIKNGQSRMLIDWVRITQKK